MRHPRGAARSHRGGVTAATCVRHILGRALALFLLLGATAYAGSAHPRLDRTGLDSLERSLSAFVSRGDIAGAAIAIHFLDAPTYTYLTGTVGRDRTAAVSADTRFRIFSMT